MTAPAKAAYVTPDLVERFARYYAANQAWGVFHVWLDDGNYRIAVEQRHFEPYPMCVPWGEGDNGTGHVAKFPRTTEELALMTEFARLTPSQRQKLGKRAEAMYRAGLPARSNA